MKRLFQFACLLSAAVMWFAACSESSLPADNPLPDDPSSPSAPSIPDEPTFEGDTVAVRIAATSLEWNAQPMSRAGGNDLYGIMVYQSDKSIAENPTAPFALVAVSVFDDQFASETAILKIYCSLCKVGCCYANTILPTV